MYQCESRWFGKGRKKNARYNYYCTSRLLPLVCLRDLILCHAFSVSQSDFTGKEYSKEGAKAANSAIVQSQVDHPMCSRLNIC